MVRATWKPTLNPRFSRGIPSRKAERRRPGGLFQEPPRITRGTQYPRVQALPSAGAPA